MDRQGRDPGQAPQEWEAWDAQEPPRGFAERVVGAAMREERASGRSRAASVGAGVVLVGAVAAALAVAVHLEHATAHGDVVAEDRREVRVGTRAIAVLEKGAHVVWDSDAITQSGGDVFWRVEPGARFVVHTPAADVTVKGTCFRVKVRGGDEDMTRRDALAGGLGAALGAAAFVGVYEGKVAVSHAGQSVDVGAGQGAQSSARGVKLTGDAASAERAFDREGDNAEQALAQANANLADSVRDYKRRLESIESEKQKLEKQLAGAETKLAEAGSDAGGGPSKSSYDLSRDDWKELAKNGELRIRLPCDDPKHEFGYSPKDLNKLGLPAQDGPILQAAMQRSYARAWGVVQPLCSQALGGVDVSRIGVQACMSILGQMTQQKGGGAYDEDLREVAEILAGERPAPKPGDAVDPLLTADLALARESQNIVSDLSASLGPDDARRVVFSEVGCWSNTTQNVGPRPTGGPAEPSDRHSAP
jgi:hypothetical protein